MKVPFEPTTTLPFAGAVLRLALSVAGPWSPARMLSATKTCGVVGGVAPTTNWVFPTPFEYGSLSGLGRTVMVRFRVPKQPKLSVAVMATAPFRTVLLGVPETCPDVWLMERPVGRPVALQVIWEPVLPVWEKVTGL